MPADQGRFSDEKFGVTWAGTAPPSRLNSALHAARADAVIDLDRRP
jgi:hypothetical protein